MRWSIEWTLPALDDYRKQVAYVRQEWGDKSAIRFTQRLAHSLKTLEQNPFIAPALDRYPGMRKLVINRHISLFYEARNGRILIIHCHNNSRNPEGRDL